MDVDVSLDVSGESRAVLLSDRAARPVRIVVIDDHVVMHAGIGVWCAEAELPMQIVGAYFNADDFLAQRPDPVDVVVLDLEIPTGRPNFPALRRIVEAGYSVLVYSLREQEEVILRCCLDEGAAGYVAKSEGRDELLRGIRAVAAGEPGVGTRMLWAMRVAADEGRVKLSEQEKAVLIAWIQTGGSQKLVAGMFFLGGDTVKEVIDRVKAKYRKAGRPYPRDKAQLTVCLIRAGEMALPDAAPLVEDDE